MAVSPNPKFKQSVKHLKSNDRVLMFKLIPYIRRNPRLLLLSVSLLFPLSIAGAIQPLIIGQAVSLLRQEGSWGFLEKLSLEQGLQFLIIVLLITIIVRLVCTSSQGFIVQKLGQNITASIREDLFTHVTSLGTSFFNRTPVGRLITRLTSDVEALGDVFASGAIGVISDTFYILFIIVTMFTVQPILALMLLLMMLPISGLIVYFQGQYRKANYKSREKLSELNSMLQENLAGINVVQLFRREQFNSELFRVINGEYRQATDKTIFHDSAVSATLEWISLVAIAAVLWLGGIYIINDTITFGTLSAFILYAQRLFNPLRQFADKFTMFQAGFTAIERITELMKEPIEIKESDKNIQFLDSRKYQDRIGEICFDNVWFGYKPNEFVLKDLNFIISPGEKVALVGPTGAGKSSIIRLLSRLYEPTKGRILMDGIDIRDISKKELRKYVGMILQESFLFAGDVKRNITLGENYSLEEVENAAKLTNVHRLIEQLPQGYHTQLRERGTNLSGGQKQLLAFARVAIRNPHILVLDEATASLDVQTEALIQEALQKLLINRTAVIIAHRLSTIRDVDKIFVLKEGSIIESGTHQQLLHQKSLYHNLYQLQMMGHEEIKK
ncbi:ABC transporter ATP-binding protein [Crocosphaera sp.]|uniref:ABC transporter ATP-binding protein n=1 Tax=Crocosphaera sp. TaxID=2729996 RepID=UPI003F208250|nr:ABC transporter ATP-binding protein [Crocosphaera sp.]